MVIIAFVEYNKISKSYQLFYSYIRAFFFIIVAQHCVWSEWTDGGCDCKLRKRRRTRHILVKEKSMCSGLKSDTETCGDKECLGNKIYRKRIKLYYINFIYIAISVHKNSMFTILDGSDNFLKEEGRYCHPNNGGTYNTLKQAKETCQPDSKCYGVEDYGCNNRGFVLCEERNMKRVTSHNLKSCFYKKGRMFFRNMPCVMH